MSSAREAILLRIRAALPGRAVASPVSAAEVRETLPRDYDRYAEMLPTARLDLLENRLRDYDAEVTHVAAHEVTAAVAAILLARGNRPTVVPPGFPAAWLPQGCDLTEDAGFTPRELDRFDGVLTTAVVAIAQTGTLVLQNVAGQGRRAATLVPDFHLCVLRAADVVETVPEAFARLAGSSTLPTTFISGPSATADIEMTRIKGVHGPRFLHIVLVESAEANRGSDSEGGFR